MSNKEENDCIFVSSRGILKTCHIHSNNPQSSCNTDRNYLVSMIENNEMFDGISIYLCSDLLLFFIEIILPKITVNFVLVSGDSDLCVPREILNQETFNKLINNMYLIKWFAQNTRIFDHPKIIQMPIGLDYHTIYNNPNKDWKKDEEGHTPQEQEQILINIRNNMRPFSNRIPKIYVNYSLSTDRFNHRKTALQQISQNLMQVNLDFTKRTDNWINISNYAFVLSPCGNGLDCHRTWEALCLGSIPIIKLEGTFIKLFEDLPVLVVGKWTDITYDLLQETLNNFASREFNMEKLKLSYWQELIYENSYTSYF